MSIEDYELPLEKNANTAYQIYKRRVLVVSILAGLGVAASLVISFPVTTIDIVVAALVSILILSALVAVFLVYEFKFSTPWIGYDKSVCSSDSLSPKTSNFRLMWEELESIIGDILEMQARQKEQDISKLYITVSVFSALLLLLTTSVRVSFHTFFEKVLAAMANDFSMSDDESELQISEAEFDNLKPSQNTPT